MLNYSDDGGDKQVFVTCQQITGLYLMPLISSFGIFGNVCNMLVYSNSKKYSTNVYLVALALADIIKLVNDFIYFLVTLVGKLDASLAESLFSSLYLYSHYVFTFSAINTAWLTCTIAIDRYVIVSSKNQVKTSELNYFKSILTSAAIMGVSCLLALPSPLFLKNVHELDPLTNKTVTKFAESDFKEVKRVYNYVNAAARALIPLALLIYLNFKIIRILYANKIRRRYSSSSSQPVTTMTTSANGGGGATTTTITKTTTNRDKAKAKSKITKMLLVIIFTFLVCVFPDAILTMMHLGYANEDYLIRAVREITDLLLAVNSASTCLICYYFSKQYRVKLKEIFGLNKIQKDTDVMMNFVDRDDETQFVAGARTHAYANHSSIHHHHHHHHHHRHHSRADIGVGGERTLLGAEPLDRSPSISSHVYMSLKP